MKVRLETEAKLYIQAGIRQGRYKLAWSYMMDFENSENPYDDKKTTIQLWKGIASTHIEPTDGISARGHEIMKSGIKPKDALYVACAIASQCKYFITTDSGLTNKAITGMKIINPVDFVMETEERP